MAVQRSGVVVLGVSADDAASHTRFASKYKLPFRLIRSTVWVGPNGVVRKHWHRVRDAAAHPAEVLTAITRE